MASDRSGTSHNSQLGLLERRWGTHMTYSDLLSGFSRGTGMAGRPFLFFVDLIDIAMGMAKGRRAVLFSGIFVCAFFLDEKVSLSNILSLCDAAGDGERTRTLLVLVFLMDLASG
ncbi:hypothetical protein AUEXF2481DRAFT_677737 [Aureobasidium subglaciale EXF-2481]|uniref:Uncharacterized protein n=1 Tax=Aureobasidium subglaciale (strain EXF-2481) TaxID=1043005 RepID=A0A074YCS7_AURSE|nr:uncharacterized protein AUEXF2481DRAFT_677737 [Aureobasidium subglaciale EXF-2481]KEQ95598.1 hypothetical protein AUEXF2481DRAFT_677737 [Aureobasidium subglaciale EXF-2481]